MKAKLLVLIIIVFIFYNCKDKTINENLYPVVQTYDAEIKDHIVLLRGQVYSLGKDSVLSYGFLIDTVDNRFKESHIVKIEVDKGLKLGEYEKDILKSWNIFFYCTYIDTKNYKVKGNSKLVIE
ncbi:hypothetical protein [Saccharicrinis sp. FJH54]|uniref:hypothetical protein n=1 Tax=Saccharicrinis sp. FJH54 TaxID=3344665 RepID=UPI0035D46D47